MITLLSTIFGFISSLAPDILGMFKEKASRKHELDMMQKQAELGLQQSREERVTAEVKAGADEFTALMESYKAELQVADKSYVARLSASVHPVITYAFFSLYAAVKVAQIYLIMNPSLPWQESASLAEAMLAAWNEEDMALFAAIMAFWFGDRQMKAWRSK